MFAGNPKPSQSPVKGEAFVDFKEYFGLKEDFSRTLNRALKKGGFTEKDKLKLKMYPNTVTKELMEECGVVAWPENMRRKVEACEKLLVEGVVGDKPQLAAIAYACLRALTKAAAQKSIEEPLAAEPQQKI